MISPLTWAWFDNSSLYFMQSNFAVSVPCEVVNGLLWEIVWSQNDGLHSRRISFNIATKEKALLGQLHTIGNDGTMMGTALTMGCTALKQSGTTACVCGLKNWGQSLWVVHCTFRTYFWLLRTRSAACVSSYCHFVNRIGNVLIFRNLSAVQMVFHKCLSYLVFILTSVNWFITARSCPRFDEAFAESTWQLKIVFSSRVAALPIFRHISLIYVALIFYWTTVWHFTGPPLTLQSRLRLSAENKGPSARLSCLRPSCTRHSSPPPLVSPD